MMHHVKNSYLSAIRRRQNNSSVGGISLIHRISFFVFDTKPSKNRRCFLVGESKTIFTFQIMVHGYMDW